jgi:hypothetical protein
MCDLNICSVAAGMPVLAMTIEAWENEIESLETRTNGHSALLIELSYMHTPDNLCKKKIVEISINKKFRHSITCCDNYSRGLQKSHYIFFQSVGVT